MSNKKSGRWKGTGRHLLFSALRWILSRLGILKQFGQPAINGTAFEPMIIIIPQTQPEAPCDGTRSAYSGRRRGTILGVDAERYDEFEGLID